MTQRPPRKLTRRKLIAGGAAGLAAAGAAAVGLSRGATSTTPRPATPSPGASPAPLPSPTLVPRGGIVHLASPVSFAFDSFDALTAADPSTVEVLGRTHSRLVNWVDFEQPRIGGDLAVSWEQPDATTWVFRLAPGVRWHDRPPANGRAMTAADVVTHLLRARDAAGRGALPAVQRPRDYLGISRITATAADRVVIETARPQPFLLNLLASRFAVVQAPEVVEALGARRGQLDASAVVGSGSFLYDVERDGALHFRAHLDSHRPPNIDGLTLSSPGSDTDAFRGKRLDELLTRDRRDAAALRPLLAAGVRELSRFEDSPIISSFFIGSAPWDNTERQRALSGALNRARLAERLTGGRAVAAGPVSPLHPAFMLDAAALARFPGYETDAEAGLRDARARWQAAGGPLLGPVTVDFPAVFEPVFAASAVVPVMLNEAFGTSQFKPAVDSYTSISAKAVSGRYGAGRAAFWFGWGPPAPDPDPSRWLIDTFHSRTSDTAYQSSATDAILDRLEVEMELVARQRLCRDAAMQILQDGGGGVLSWLLQRNEVFRWGYYTAARPSPVWGQHLDSASSLDAAAVSWGGRPG